MYKLDIKVLKEHLGKTKVVDKNDFWIIESALCKIDGHRRASLFVEYGSWLGFREETKNPVKSREIEINKWYGKNEDGCYYFNELVEEMTEGLEKVLKENGFDLSRGFKIDFKEGVMKVSQFYKEGETQYETYDECMSRILGLLLDQQ